MAVAVRIIPCLDVDNGRVVKGVNFANLRDAGDPVELAKRYGEAGADDLYLRKFGHGGSGSRGQFAPHGESGDHLGLLLARALTVARDVADRNRRREHAMVIRAFGLDGVRRDRKS